MASITLDFYEKMKKMQEQQHDREQQRLDLEKQLYSYVKSDVRSASQNKNARLQAYWKKICENERQSQIRNQALLDEFEKAEKHSQLLAQRTEKLRVLKQQYEDYIDRVYPEWKKNVQEWNKPQQTTQGSSHIIASSAQPVHSSPYQYSTPNSKHESILANHEQNLASSLPQGHLRHDNLSGARPKQQSPVNVSVAVSHQQQAPNTAERVASPYSLKQDSSKHSPPTQEKTPASNYHLGTHSANDLGTPQESKPLQDKIDGVHDRLESTAGSTLRDSTSLISEEADFGQYKLDRQSTLKSDADDDEQFSLLNDNHEPISVASDLNDSLSLPLSISHRSGGGTGSLKLEKSRSEEIHLPKHGRKSPSKLERSNSPISLRTVSPARAPGSPRSSLPPTPRSSGRKSPHIRSPVQSPEPHNHPESSLSAKIGKGSAESRVKTPVLDNVSKSGPPRKGSPVPSKILNSIHADSPTPQKTKPMAGLSLRGLIVILKDIQNDYPNTLATEEFYRTTQPSNFEKKDVIHKANSRLSLERKDTAQMSMVVIDELPLICQELPGSCLLNDKIIQSSSFVVKEADIRPKLSGEALLLWDALASHMHEMVRHSIMNPRETAALFGPLVVRQTTANKDKAVAFIASFLQNISIDDSDISEVLTPPVTAERPFSPPKVSSPTNLDDIIEDDSVAKSTDSEKPPIITVTKEKSDTNLSASEAYYKMLGGGTLGGTSKSETDDKKKTSTLDAYQKMLGGTSKSEDEEDEASELDDIEKQLKIEKKTSEKGQSGQFLGFSGMDLRASGDSTDLSQNIESESVASSASAVVPSYVPSAMEKSGQSTGAANTTKKALQRVHSDFETDTEVSLGMSTQKMKDEDDIDFDFYG